MDNQTEIPIPQNLNLISTNRTFTDATVPPKPAPHPASRQKQYSRTLVVSCSEPRFDGGGRPLPPTPPAAIMQHVKSRGTITPALITKFVLASLHYHSLAAPFPQQQNDLVRAPCAHHGQSRIRVYRLSGYLTHPANRRTVCPPAIKLWRLIHIQRKRHKRVFYRDSGYASPDY